MCYLISFTVPRQQYLRQCHFSLFVYNNNNLIVYLLYALLQRGRPSRQHAEKHRRLQVRLQQHPAAVPAETLSTSARHIRKHRQLTHGTSHCDFSVSVYRLVALFWSSSLETRDLHGDGDRGNPAGMEASVAGFPRGWKQMLRDSCGDGKIFYGIPAGM